MKRLALVAAFAIGVGVTSAQDADLRPEVHLASGVLRGSDRDANGVLAFKGVPYAAPPVGSLRWRSPEAALPWKGVRDATQYGSRCWSALVGTPMPGTPFSEDCLTVNIWTGARRPAEKRPVMVWVHGGGFEFGSSMEPNTDGARFAEKGVVLVSLNYRLGVFGFLAHPELDREGPSGDYGLQDQLAALRWVRANIANFGGDPDNVTLFGESAGSHAIGILMASPLSKGLFQKAIGSSGAFWDGEHGSLATFEEAHSRGIRFVKDMGANTIAELRATTAERLNSAAPWSFRSDPIVSAFSPNVDHYIVPELPAARFLSGKQMRIPLLAGWNEHESIPFGMWALPHGSPKAFRDAAEQVFGSARIAEFLTLYPAGTDVQAKQSAEALAGDMVIAEQTWEWLDLQRRTAKMPVYGYKFTYTSAYLPVAAHATDVSFVFGTLPPAGSGPNTDPKREPGETDRAMASTMMAYMIHFARTGDPNGPGLPRWPTFDGNTVLELGRTIAPATPVQIARFRFLASYRRGGAFPANWRKFPSPMF